MRIASPASLRWREGGRDWAEGLQNALGSIRMPSLLLCSSDGRLCLPRSARWQGRGFSQYSCRLRPLTRGRFLTRGYGGCLHPVVGGGGGSLPLPPPFTPPPLAPRNWAASRTPSRHGKAANGAVRMRRAPPVPPVCVSVMGRVVPTGSPRVPVRVGDSVRAGAAGGLGGSETRNW